MSQELSTPLPRLSASAPSATSVWLRRGAIVLSASALVALCAHVALPLYFTPVPITLGPLAVLLIGLLLSPRMAASSLTAYLAEGAAGLPVFVPSPLTGLAHLLGPTGGYLLAYPLAAALISFLWRRSGAVAGGRGFGGEAFLRALASVAAGDLLILASGGLWLAVLTHLSFRSALALGVVPFLVGEAFKIAAAAAFAAGFLRLRPTAR